VSSVLLDTKQLANVLHDNNSPFSFAEHSTISKKYSRFSIKWFYHIIIPALGFFNLTAIHCITVVRFQQQKNTSAELGDVQALHIVLTVLLQSRGEEEKIIWSSLFIQRK